MTFGERMKLLRKEINISQEDLARKIGVARTSVANYETNRNYPTSEVLERLSETLNCSIDYLLGKSNIRNYEDKIKKEFESEYCKEIKGLTKDEVIDALRVYKKIKYGDGKKI